MLRIEFDWIKITSALRLVVLSLLMGLPTTVMAAAEICDDLGTVDEDSDGFANCADLDCASPVSITGNYKMIVSDQPGYSFVVGGGPIELTKGLFASDLRTSGGTTAKGTFYVSQGVGTSTVLYKAAPTFAVTTGPDNSEVWHVSGSSGVSATINWFGKPNYAPVKVGGYPLIPVLQGLVVAPIGMLFVTEIGPNQTSFVYNWVGATLPQTSSLTIKINGTELLSIDSAGVASLVEGSTGTLTLTSSLTANLTFASRLRPDDVITWERDGTTIYTQTVSEAAYAEQVGALSFSFPTSIRSFSALSNGERFVKMNFTLGTFAADCPTQTVRAGFTTAAPLTADGSVYSATGFATVDELMTSDQSITITEDESANTSFQTHALNEGIGSVIGTVLTIPTKGDVVFDGLDFTYTPHLNANGSDSFTYNLSDGTAYSNISVVSITITPINDAPVALPQAFSTEADVPYSGTLVATDVDNVSRTYSIVSSDSAQGTVNITDSATGAFTYTPAFHYYGSASFTFKANDGSLDSNTATVMITVNHANTVPATADGSVTTSEDTPANFTLSATDPDTDYVPPQVLTYSIVSAPSNGVLTGTGSSRTYTPNTNYNGSDSFTFRVSDGLAFSNTSTVNITVDAVNDTPVADAQTITPTEDVEYSGTLIATDVESSSLTYSLVSTASAHGTVTITNAATGAFTYTTDTSYTGAASFTFKANDGALDSNVATVTVTITPVNDAPVADAQTITPTEDVLYFGTLGASDVDSGSLTYSLVSVADAHGTVTITNSATGTFTYTTEQNYTGSASFTFKVSDGSLESNTATVTITITPANDAPVAEAQSFTVAEDGGVGRVLTATDIDSATLTYSIVTGPSHGSISGLPNTTGSFTYTTTTNYNGSDTFTFKANDGSADSASATVTVTISASNDVPSASAFSMTINEDNSSSPQTSAVTPLPTINFASQGNVSDPDTDALLNTSPQTLTYWLNALPINGTLRTSATDLSSGTAITSTGAFTGSVLYLHPNANATNGLSFSYKVCDNNTQPPTNASTCSSNRVVGVTVTSVNDLPVATVPDPLTVYANKSTIVTLTGTDVESSVVVTSADTKIIGSGSCSTASLRGSGCAAPATVLYSAPINPSSTSDSYAFTVSDGTVTDSTTGQVTVQYCGDGAVNGDAYGAGEFCDGSAIRSGFNLTTMRASCVSCQPIAYVGNDSSNPLGCEVPSDTNLATSATNCGACYQVCASGLTCGGGHCIYGAPLSAATTDLAPTTDLTMTGGVYEYAMVNIPSGVTVGQSGSGVLEIRALGDITIGGILNLSGGPGGDHVNLGGNTYNPGGGGYLGQYNTTAGVTNFYKALGGGGGAGASWCTAGCGAGADGYNAFSYGGNLGGGGGGPGNVNNATSYGSGAGGGGFAGGGGGAWSYPGVVGGGSEGGAAGAGTGNLPGSGGGGGAITLASPYPGVSATYGAGGGGSIGSGSANELTAFTTFRPGSGGGGGGAGGAGAPGGGGGGGALRLTSVYGTITVNGQVLARGGNGGGNWNVGGGGGSGGIVYLQAPALIIGSSGTVSATGGAAGFPYAGGGGAGRARLAVDSCSVSGALTIDASAGNDFIDNGNPCNPTPSCQTNLSTRSSTCNGKVFASPFTNNIPVANSMTPSTDEDVAVAITLNGTDANSDQLTYTLFTGPTHGTLGTLNASTGAVTYTPNGNYNGTDTFYYQVNDGFAISSAGVVTITVNAVNDTPAASAQSVSTNEDIALPVTLTATDPDTSDASPQTLTYSIVANPTNGMLGTLNASTGAVTYTPTANYHGSDSFTFKACDNDSTPACSSTMTISITVNNLNDDPVPDPQTVSTNEDVPLGITMTATDPDVATDGQTLTYYLIQPPSNGDYPFNSSTGVGTYTPYANYNGTDFIYFFVCDPYACSSGAFIDITVNALNDAPVVTTPATFTVAEDTAAPGVCNGSNCVTLTGTDVDTATTSVNVIVVTLPSAFQGTLLTSAGGAITAGQNIGNISSGQQYVKFVPFANYNGPSSFTFKLNDGSADSTTVTASITVTSVQDTPVANAQTTSVNFNTATVLTLTITDPDADTWAWSIIANPTNGALSSLTTSTSSNSTTVTYTPTTGYVGSDSFTFRVNDGTANSNTATVTLNVKDCAGTISGTAFIDNCGTCSGGTSGHTACAVVISAVSGGTLFEGRPNSAAIYDTYTITMTGNPTSNVTVTITNPSPSDINIPGSLTRVFTSGECPSGSGNWCSNSLRQVSAVDRAGTQGARTLNITHSVSIADGSPYVGAALANAAITVAECGTVSPYVCMNFISAPTSGSTNGTSTPGGVSDDGCYVGFVSASTNLVGSDTNGFTDPFYRSCLTSSTTRIKASSNAGDAPTRIEVSSDGRYYLFWSTDTALVGSDTNGAVDLFRWDRTLSSYEVASLRDGATTINAADTQEFGTNFSMSANGQYITFEGRRVYRSASDSDAEYDVYIRDMSGTRTVQATLNSSGGNGTDVGNANNAFGSRISGNGRFLPFVSWSGNLVTPNPALGFYGYVKDLTTFSSGETGTLIRSSHVSGSSTAVAITDVIATFVGMDASNNVISVFPSPNSSIVASDTNGLDDVFYSTATSVSNLADATVLRIMGTGGAQPTGGASKPVAISDDGRFIFFFSSATNMVASDTNGVQDLFVFDRGGTNPSTLSPNPMRLSVDSSGNQLSSSTVSAAVSHNGRFVTFSTAAAISGDSGSAVDVFMIQLW
jgi:VCBS repeat-containing protein